MSDLRKQTLATAIAGLKAKQFSLDELYKELDAAIEEKKELNIYLTRNDQAHKDAETKTSQPLAGLPIAVKDNFCSKDLRTTASSKVLDNFVPQFESTVTKKLQDAGGVIVGKTNLDAWAHGSSTETSAFGPTLNPRNTKHLPGGSSGGSAAAVAADLCLSAIGSETGGSIRQPAAWCGTVGLKPTYGRISRYGIAAMASSTDSPGPLTKTVEDAAILLNHMAGRDPLDATTSPQEVPDFTKSLDKSAKNLRVGIIYSDILLPETKAYFQAAYKQLGELVASIEEVEALDPNLAVGVYTVVQRSEVSSNLARYTGLRYGNDRKNFGEEARKRSILGTFTLSKGYADKYYSLTQKVRTLFIKNFEKLFEKYDVLVSPSSPGFAKKLGASEGQAMFGELEDLQLEPSSIVGLPGISVPCYHDDKTNLYLGLDIVAPMWREDLVLQVAHTYEKATKWNSWGGSK